MASSRTSASQRLPLHVVSVLATAVIFSFLSSFPTSLACPLLLRGWSNNQSWLLAEKVERADIVVVARVVSSDRHVDPEGKVKRYSANCLILEVSKGLPLFASASDFSKHRVKVVDGFGSVKDCRSDVKVGRVYLMILTVRSGHLVLYYKVGIPAVKEFSPADYNIVRDVLGEYELYLCFQENGCFELRVPLANIVVTAYYCLLNKRAYILDTRPISHWL